MDANDISPPGQNLLNILKEHTWTQVMFAQMIKYSFKTVNELIKGKMSITPKMALDLEAITGVDAYFWLCRDAAYQLHLLRVNRNIVGSP